MSAQEEQKQQVIFVKTLDGEQRQLPLKVQKFCLLIYNVLEQSSAQKTKTDPIYLSINNNTLNHILQYCQNHDYQPPKAIQKPLKSDDLLICGVLAIDLEYLQKFDLDGLIDLLKAAEYINNPYLQDLVYAKLALDVKRLNPRKLFELHGLDIDMVTEDDYQMVQDKYSFLITDIDRLIKEQLETKNKNYIQDAEQ